MARWNLPSLIDHTVLKPEATKADVLRLCQEAKQHGFTVIFVACRTWWGNCRTRGSFWSFAECAGCGRSC